MAKAKAPSYTYRAQLVRVVDGDTAVLEIDVGFRFRAVMPVRLYGLNTPEKNTPLGRAALVASIAWFAEHPDLVVTTEANPEKYGRWLATVAGADGSVLNDTLIRDGHAVAWDGKGVRPT